MSAYQKTIAACHSISIDPSPLNPIKMACNGSYFFRGDKLKKLTNPLLPDQHSGMVSRTGQRSGGEGCGKRPGSEDLQDFLLLCDS